MYNLLILAILPFSSFFLQRYFATVDHQVSQFNHHWTVLYGDWIFLPINLVFFFSVTCSSSLVLLLFSISLCINSGTHITWGLTTKNCHFYTETGHLSKAGFVHLLFSAVEGTIIFMILFFTKGVIATLFGSFLLMVFAVFLPYGSYKFRHEWTTIEKVVGGILFGCAVLKLCTVFI